MKDYLTADELNDLLFTTYLIERNRDTAKTWGNRDNLTKEELRYLKTACTWTDKFMLSVLGRLPKKQVEKFALRTVRAMKDPVRIIDKWSYDRILGNIEKELEVIKMPRGEFDFLAESLIKVHCIDCKKSLQDCDLYDLLNDNMYPTADKQYRCPYSWSEYKEPKEKKEKGKLSKRKQKKLANRFDEDDE